MARKCFSPLPSSYASIYLITAFFAVSLISLLYLTYPQQYITHFDYLRIIKLDPTPIPLSKDDFTAPSVNVPKEPIVVNPVLITPSTSPSPSAAPSVTVSKEAGVVEPVISPSTAPLSSSDSQLPPPPVAETPAPAVQEEGNNDQLSPTSPVLDSPVTDAVDNSSETENKIKAEEEISTRKDNLAPIIDSKTVAVNQTASETQEDQVAEDEEEDEPMITTVDPLALPTSITTKEGRMKWIKEKLPESTILVSTTKTRSFEQKVQQFISANKCRVSIFMTWISPTKYFGKREFFSLESVVKAHPRGCVIIVSRIMASKEGRAMIQPLIERGHHILSVVPDFPLLFSGTPAQDWLQRLKDGNLDPGNIPITQNLSNLLRLVVLYKYGGVYFDTDMIILKDVSGLRNSIGIQEVDAKRKTWNSVNNAVLIFDKEHPLLLRFLEEFNSTFDGSLWGHNGPYMATRIIRKIVHDTRYQFNIMSPMAFYPIDWFKIYKFYRNPYENETEWANDMFYKVSKESYGVHLWNKVSRSLKIEKGSVIGRVISEHCIICQDVYDS